MVKSIRSADTDISQPWTEGNQAWWDWYVGLAVNHEAQESIQAADPLPSIILPSDDALIAELHEPYSLSNAEIGFFKDNGYIKLKGVLSPGAVLKLRVILVDLLEAAFETTLDGGVQDRFLSLEMVWLEHELLRAYVLSPKIAKICSDLLAVPSVRLYHDNVLSKEPGCGRTPWHFDDHHFPLDSHDVVTAWIPAQPIPLAMGPLAFAYPIGIWQLVNGVTFEKSTTAYDNGVTEIFAREKVQVNETPFEIGEVSFHHNLNFHTAASNRTNRSRIVLANTYYADGVRVLNSPTMVSGDWQKFMPGVGPGDVAKSALNPICWPVSPLEATDGAAH